MARLFSEFIFLAETAGGYQAIASCWYTVKRFVDITTKKTVK